MRCFKYKGVLVFYAYCLDCFGQSNLIGWGRATAEGGLVQPKFYLNPETVQRTKENGGLRAAGVKQLSVVSAQKIHPRGGINAYNRPT